MARGPKFPKGADPERRPPWLKVRYAPNERAQDLGKVIEQLGLHTVCTEAKCPNISECWGVGTATLMILGDTCTRTCSFCAVASGAPKAADPAEPENVAKAIHYMNLDHVVITSVDRDDLPDFGAQHWADTIRWVHKINPTTTVEVLTGDFKGRPELIEKVLEAQPEVFSHNLETTRELTRQVRSNSDYERSLQVLKFAVDWGSPRVKTSMMLGMGETMEQVRAAMADAREVGVSFFSIGQYLRPTRHHHQVQRFWHPDEFEALRLYGEKELGFAFVEAGPLVRSSYHAERAVNADRQMRELA